MAELHEKILDHLFDGVYFADCSRRITYWNRSAERITGYAREEVVGRCCGDNVLRHVDVFGQELCQTGCPVSATLQDGQPREADVFLHRKDGVRLPVSVRVTPLRDEAGAIVGAVEVFCDCSEKQGLLRRMEDIQRESLTDPLTGAGNRRHGELVLANCLREQAASRLPFGVLLADLDHFKRVNDTYGHVAGDEVIRGIAERLKKGCRPYDVVGRYGGEEFLVVLSQADEECLKNVAERLWEVVRSAPFRSGETDIPVTISLGVAASGGVVERCEQMIKRADDALYRAKSEGRDRICYACPQEEVYEYGKESGDENPVSASGQG